MKTILLSAFILCMAAPAPAQTHITVPDSTGKQAVTDTTIVKAKKVKHKNIITRREGSDSTNKSSDLNGDNNRTLDRSDVNGGNNADINRGYPVGK